MYESKEINFGKQVNMFKVTLNGKKEKKKKKKKHLRRKMPLMLKEYCES